MPRPTATTSADICLAASYGPESPQFLAMELADAASAARSLIGVRASARRSGDCAEVFELVLDSDGARLFDTIRVGCNLTGQIRAVELLRTSQPVPFWPCLPGALAALAAIAGGPARLSWSGLGTGERVGLSVEDRSGRRFKLVLAVPRPRAGQRRLAAAQ